MAVGPADDVKREPVRRRLRSKYSTDGKVSVSPCAVANRCSRTPSAPAWATALLVVPKSKPMLNAECPISGRALGSDRIEEQLRRASSALRAPTPLTGQQLRRVMPGFSRAISRSVASWKMT